MITQAMMTAQRHLTDPPPSRSSRRFTDRPSPGRAGHLQYLSDLMAMPASPMQGEGWIS
jgi:hypothetical protein